MKNKWGFLVSIMAMLIFTLLSISAVADPTPIWQNTLESDATSTVDGGAVVSGPSSYVSGAYGNAFAGNGSVHIDWDNSEVAAIFDSVWNNSLGSTVDMYFFGNHWSTHSGTESLFSVFDRFGGPDGYMTYWIKDGNLMVLYKDSLTGNGYNLTIPGVTLADNIIYRLTVRQLGNDLQVYLDGGAYSNAAPVYTKTDFGGTVSFPAYNSGIGGRVMQVGDEQFFANPLQSGNWVDEIRIFNGYYTPAEIGLPSSACLEGDVNGDCIVDLTDLVIMAENWLASGMTSLQGNLNATGLVDLSDYTVVAADWLSGAFVTIKTQPQSVVENEGETVSFTVLASGSTPFSYQWQKDTIDLPDGSGISGATTAMLTISNIESSDDGSYCCVVSNRYSSETSDMVTLTVVVGAPVGRQTRYESNTGRRYILYVPTDYNPELSYPLIISSHGTSQNGDTEMDSTGPNSGYDNGTPTWPTLAENNDVIVACPDMTGAYGPCTIGSTQLNQLASDDTATLNIISEIEGLYNINSARVMLTGFSGGGHVVHYVGLRHPEVFSAICSRHGNFDEDEVPATLPSGVTDMPVYIFNGTNDTVCGPDESIAWYTTQGFSLLNTDDFDIYPSNVHTTDRHHALNWFLGMAFTVLPSGDTGLYNTFELEFFVTGVPDNKFTKFVSVTFTKGGQSFDIEGFYDGNDVWRARFMPNEEGSWNYTWSLAGLNSPATGSGSFTCTAKTNTKAHGHVHVDPAHSRYLVHDDGTAHHWYGGTWIMGTHYGPLTKGGQTNPDTLDGFPVGRISDAEFISYLDDCETYQHNGLLLKTALFPLENDKLSWDLTWIHRGDWLVQEMAARGIYCQVNFFDTWARHKDYWFKWTWPNSGESGAQQPFNVWASGDEAAKENYIRYLVARFSGYYNVYFELGNEMEHYPNSGTAFVTQANNNYIPWYRTYDPYGLPIGLSETGIAQSANVDIVFVHQTGTFPGVSAAEPWIMNELVSGWSGGGLYDDGVIRNSSNRLGYRRTFWRMFVYGGVGSSEATWLNIGNALNSAVYDVMGDQQRIREFNESLPTHINDMVTDTGFVVSGPGEKRTRSKAGQCYVTYYLGNSGAGNVAVNLPAGDYDSKWYNPSNGIYSNQTSFSHGGGNKVISYPAFSEDIVHVIVKAGS